MINNIHTRIRDAREKSGLSITEAAKRVGVSQPAWSKWESGRSEPRGIHQRRLADVLGCNLDWLRTGEGPERSTPLPSHGSEVSASKTDSAIPEFNSQLMERVKDSVLRAIRNSKKNFTYAQKVDLVLRVYAICEQRGLETPLDLEEQDLKQLSGDAS